MDDAPAAAPKSCCICEEPGSKHCTKCKSRHYCSKKCQLFDWKEGGHKAQCRHMATAFQDRLLDELMPAKKVKEEPPIVADVAPAAGLKAAARLTAARTAKAGEAGAVKDGTPGWRGTCAICLDLLPIKCYQQSFYECCCTTLCTACSDKCKEYDDRCPLCRRPRTTSGAEVLRRLQKHVDEGNAEAQVELGDAYWQGGVDLKKSNKRAFQMYQLAAAQGHAIGQVKLGEFYQFGGNVKINYKTAAQWYRRAADQEHPHAQFYLGHLFYNGKGVAQSYDEAVRLFRLAAAEGYPEALHNLGDCYAGGHGVPQDCDEALCLFKRAAANGHAGAAEKAAEISLRLAARASG